MGTRTARVATIINGLGRGQSPECPDGRQLVSLYLIQYFL